MKKILSLLIVLTVTIISHAAILPPSKTINENTVEKSGIESIKKFSTMTLSEYETFLGHKASKLEKFAFERMQKKSSKMFDENGTLHSKYEKKFNKMYEGGDGSFLGGFALGFFLGAIGLLLAYFAFKDGDHKNRIKGAWWGFGAVAIIYLILIFAWIAAAAAVTTI
jgi:hypothetical protein